MAPWTVAADLVFTVLDLLRSVLGEVDQVGLDVLPGPRAGEVALVPGRGGQDLPCHAGFQGFAGHGLRDISDLLDLGHLVQLPGIPDVLVEGKLPQLLNLLFHLLLLRSFTWVPIVQQKS